MDYKLPKRIENSNKATYGRVLNVAGSDYMPGAAMLSSVSALMVGCGYCFLASTERVIDAVAAQTQNIVFVPLNKLEQQINSAPDVIEIGCGLSQGEGTIEIFNKTIKLADSEKALIIDADGLNILAKNPDLYLGRDLKNVILTPHPKEASRLLACSLDEVLADFEGAAAKISEKYHCVTVLKSHRTVVYSPDGRKYLNTTGNNAMAKAGSGDVLAGMVSGLVAQGMEIFEGAVLGTYLHGLSGDFAKNDLTEYSVMAADLIRYIPCSIKTLVD